MITQEVTNKIEKLVKPAKTKKAPKPQTEGSKQKAAKDDVVIVDPAPVAPVVASISVTPATPAAAKPAAPAAEIAAPVAPAAPAVPPLLREQVFQAFGLRAKTHRAALVELLVDKLNTQIPITTLAAVAWDGVSQKTNTTTSVSTSVKKLELRIVRNKPERQYKIVRETVGGERTVGLHTI